MLELVAAGRPIVDVARELGISAQSIYTWSMFEFLEIRHDRHRRLSALGWLSPIEFATQKRIVAVQGFQEPDSTEPGGTPGCPPDGGHFTRLLEGAAHPAD